MLEIFYSSRDFHMTVPLIQNSECESGLNVADIVTKWDRDKIPQHRFNSEKKEKHESLIYPVQILHLVICRIYSFYCTLTPNPKAPQYVSVSFWTLFSHFLAIYKKRHKIHPSVYPCQGRGKKFLFLSKILCLGHFLPICITEISQYSLFSHQDIAHWYFVRTPPRHHVVMHWVSFAFFQHAGFNMIQFSISSVSTKKTQKKLAKLCNFVHFVLNLLHKL